MSTNVKTIYLSKDGKVFGPYSKEEYSELKRTADFHEFSWIWTEDSPGWVPINPPTVPPTGNTKEIYVKKSEQFQTTQTQQTQAIPTKPAFSGTQTSIYHHQPGSSHTMQTQVRPVSNAKIKAICHNEQQMISGEVIQINAHEFKFLSSNSQEMIPAFGSGHQVMVNLLDIHSGQSENASAKILDVKRMKGFWEYQMQWTKSPKNIHP